MLLKPSGCYVAPWDAGDCLCSAQALYSLTVFVLEYIQMVKLVDKKNIDKIAGILYRILRFQEIFTHIIEINNPDISPCVYAMWHENQFSIHGIKDKSNLNVLISNSKDGEIISNTVEKWGFKVVRGSSARKGCVSSTIHLISMLKNGECAAIMVDGPRGPLHKVKGGAIKLAKETGAPIVPMHWYSPQKTFISLPSWDKIKIPAGPCYIINLYGEPIYVKPDDDEAKIALQIKASLEELAARAPEEYKKAKELKLWKKYQQCKSVRKN